MRKFVLAFALVVAFVPTLVFGEEDRRTPRCKLFYGNYAYENQNWDRLEAQLIVAGGCTTSTTVAPTTTTTAAPTTTTAAPTTTTAAPTTTTAAPTTTTAAPTTTTTSTSTTTTTT